MGDVVKNMQGQDCWVVDYDEDQWFKYDERGQQHCIDTWIAKAKPMGCHYLVIMLTPDALFPSRDKTVRYVYRSIPIDQGNFDPFIATVRCQVSIDTDTWEHASDGQRIELRAKARARAAMTVAPFPGASYTIVAREGKELKTVEQGRF